jgi:uncharacterized protein DUF6878
MSDMPTPQQIETSWEAEQAALREALPARRDAIIAAMKTLGVATLSVNYDGEGDQGQVNEMFGLDAQNKRVNIDAHLQAIEDFTWDVLQLHHAGFDNNDGGYGELVFNVADGTCELSHYDRVVDSVFSGTEV